jgi:hypothetical protein
MKNSRVSTKLMLMALLCVGFNQSIQAIGDPIAYCVTVITDSPVTVGEMMYGAEKVAEASVEVIKIIDRNPVIKVALIEAAFFVVGAFRSVILPL